MFIINDMIASSSRDTSLQMVKLENSQEFYHIVPTHLDCSFIQHITDYDEKSCIKKLSNEKVKHYMVDQILSKLKQEDFKINPKELTPNCWSLLNLSILAFTQRFLSWKEITKKISGPAINFKVRTAHLNAANPWHSTLDCDFILSFHSPTWPTPAREWLTRVRAWPGQDDVKTVVMGGCELVPKVGLSDDQFRWRLSFSRAEGFLASKVQPKQRVCYFALKAFFKTRLKHVCTFFKSYHIKTLFFYFLQGKSHEYWNNTSEENIVLDLLDMVHEALKTKMCPHFFIFELNLWETKDLEDYVKFRKQSNRAMKLLNDTMTEKHLFRLFIPAKIQTKILLDDQNREKIQSSWKIFCKIIFCLSLCFIISSPVFILMLIMLLQNGIVWIIGSVCSLPLILVFLMMLYISKKCCL